MNRTRRVLQFNERFFERTQTFLYNLIMGLARWEPVLACRELVNREEFPADGLSVVNPHPRAGTARNLVNKLLRKTRVGDPAFAKMLRELKPALVHAHFGPNGIRAELACRRASLPLIVSFYGYDSAPPTSKLARHWVRGYRRLFASAGMVLAEGPCIARRLQEHWGCSAAKTRILRITIPVEQIASRVVKARDGGPVRLLFCGRFMEKKGLGILLEALGRLGGGAKDYHLRVIGDGDLKEQLQSRVKELGLERVVLFMGMQPRSQFWRELQDCHLLVAPSLTARNGDTEGGAPTVLLEAQAAGVPLVTTDHADIPFVVSPEGSAFLAKEGDVESLAHTLKEAVSQSNRWAEMGANGRRFVLENHSTRAVCSQLEALYSEIAESACPAGAQGRLPRS